MTRFYRHFLVLFTSVPFFTQAQDTLHRYNYFTIGNSYPYMYLDSIHKNTTLISGNNVVWDFSNALPTPLSLDDTHAIDPSTTVFYNAPNCNYNITDLCLYEPKGTPGWPYDDSLHSYYLTDPTSIQFVGDWAKNNIWEVWKYHMTNTETYFKFPFALNDSFQDTYYGSAIDLSGSGTHKFYGTRTVTADGYGTLILPTGTYTNCLRIKSERLVTDSSAVMGVNTFIHMYYTWFQLSTNGPILQLRSDTNYYEIQAKYYYNNNTVGIKEQPQISRCLVFPNPSTGKFNIDTKSENEKSLQVYDLNGRMVFQQNIFAKATIDLSILSEGVYTLTIKSRSGITNKKLVIVK
ncbi:MAG: T9SS type A sorting domain-containing protein [Bacteroidota bacterium]